MVTRGSTLAVFGCTQAPAGLLDRTPVVLIMRAFELSDAPEIAVDQVVQARALLDRLARKPWPPAAAARLDLDVPDVTVSTAWAGVLPPQTGWEPVGVMDAESLTQVAEDGISRVEAALPESPGEPVVRAVRASVWGIELMPGVPAAAAFAAETLGFLRGEAHVRVAKSRSWVRLSTTRGHVLVRA